MIYVLIPVVFVGSWWLPWWWIGIPAFAVGYREKSFFKAFFTGFLGLFLVWASTAYYFDAQAQGQVSERLAGMFGLPLSLLTYVMTGLVGALIGSIFSLAGHSLRRLRASAS